MIVWAVRKHTGDTEMGVTCGEDGTGERRDKVRLTRSVGARQNLKRWERIDEVESRTQSVMEDRREGGGGEQVGNEGGEN